MAVFRNRRQAGERLAEALRPTVQHPGMVYALPRGGVPVAVAVAIALDLPLDLLVARKIGHPLQPEYAIGAVTEHGEPVYSEHERRGLDDAWLTQRVAEQRGEARRRRDLYCGGRPRLSAEGRCAVLVDDGIATGLTMLAAIREVQADRPAALIVAVPVAPADTAARFGRLANHFVAVDVPAYFRGAVGAYYEDFAQLSDQDVLDALARVRRSSEE